MNNENAIKKSWLSEAWLLTFFWFPPFGIIALYHAFKGRQEAKAGRAFEALKQRVITRSWIRWGVVAGMVWLVALAAYIFIKGGEVIPALSSFY